ncbi:hypothetical protein B7P43_G11357 [Cryptotermes secundus]|uniref:Uncharacterized protein n=1 Tax=Cryptotermes secundus TaxID=105785 RepID=A0A2J7QDF9_9NEOP|nr:hypothetical protein B7P43_G11357 [Cryptotermes secundus]
MKREAACYSVVSVNFYQTTWCYIPEESTLQNTSMCCEEKTNHISVMDITW